MSASGDSTSKYAYTLRVTCSPITAAVLSVAACKKKLAPRGASSDSFGSVVTAGGGAGSRPPLLRAGRNNAPRSHRANEQHTEIEAAARGAARQRARPPGATGRDAVGRW